jgi:hypothetical protein
LSQEMASDGVVFGCLRRWEVAGTTHPAMPGLCPPETSLVGIDVGRGEGYMVALNRSQNGHSGLEQNGRNQIE